MLNGIDISHHNRDQIRRGSLNIAAPDFVIMKATEGKTYHDPEMANYIGLMDHERQLLGFYHYCRPENGNSPYSEALHFCRTISKYVGVAVLALDVEEKALDYPNIGRWVLSWCRSVESMTGVKPLIYCQRSALSKFKEAAAADFGLWLAAWIKSKPQKCEPWRFMAIWQNNGYNIDTDYFFGSPAQWKKYAAVAGRK